MRVAVFSTKPYDREFLLAANQSLHELHFFEPRLNQETVALAADHAAVCVFVNDDLGAEVIGQLAAGGTRLIALRCAGYNNVDLDAARNAGLMVARVLGYSPYAVAEHAMGLILALNRKLHRAYNRVREGNFSLNGLLGFDLHGKTIGLIGTGNIGTVMARILGGFGVDVLAFDPFPNEDCRSLGVCYTDLPTLLSRSDVISLHCPLTAGNRHLIDAAALAQMRDGAMLINTSRGALIDTVGVIEALKCAKLGALGLDVYEEEEQIFFEDRSSLILNDDVFSRLLTFPNVIITGHQAFFTREALTKIAQTTIGSVTDFEHGRLTGPSVGTAFA